MAEVPTIPDSLRDALARKVVLPETFYGDVTGKIRAASATVSGLASLDQVQDIIDSLRRAMDAGQSFQSWRRDLLESGRDFGLARHRLELIYRNNIQGWYSAGRAEAVRRNMDAFPYLRYSAVLDSRVRPSHARLHGLILPVDHPFWKSYYPPCGHNCRCQAIPMTERAARDAIAKAREDGNVVDEVPTDLPRLDPGWDYDRLQADAPLQGLENAVAKRQSICVPSQYARRTPSQTVWCDGPGAQALERAATALRFDEPMPDVRRLDEALDLPHGMKPEAYIGAFMAEFGAGAKETVLHNSLPGVTLAVSRGIFEKHSGASKLKKRGREVNVRYIAQAIKDPDEVWYVRDSGGSERVYYLARMQAGRDELHVLAVFRWDGRVWEPVTGYQADAAHYLPQVRAQLGRDGFLLFRR